MSIETKDQMACCLCESINYLVLVPRRNKDERITSFDIACIDCKEKVESMQGDYMFKFGELM